MRIFDFAQQYEIKGFQDELNKEAQSYLKSRGVEISIMPAPQGAAVGILEGVSWELKITSLFIKIIPAISKYMRKVHESKVDDTMRKFTILLDASNAQENAARNSRLSKSILMKGYDLKLHLEGRYPNYIFKLQTFVGGESNDCMLQVYVNKLRPTKADIGRLLKYMDKKPKGNHFIEYIFLENNSKLRYSFYDRGR